MTLARVCLIGGCGRQEQGENIFNFICLIKYLGGDKISYNQFLLFSNRENLEERRVALKIYYIKKLSIILC
jgi:hypothetical protein